MPARRKGAFGQAGERHARAFLEGLGMRFVTANWHCEDGELDLVMLDGEELVVVEVKTHRGSRSGAADESVTDAQASRILAAAEWFLAAHEEHQDRIWRGDIVAISVDPGTGRASARHYVNAIVSG